MIFDFVAVLIWFFYSSGFEFGWVNVEWNEKLKNPINSPPLVPDRVEDWSIPG